MSVLFASLLSAAAAASAQSQRFGGEVCWATESMQPIRRMALLQKTSSRGQSAMTSRLHEDSGETSQSRNDTSADSADEEQALVALAQLADLGNSSKLPFGTFSGSTIQTNVEVRTNATHLDSLGDSANFSQLPMASVALTNVADEATTEAANANSSVTLEDANSSITLETANSSMTLPLIAIAGDASQTRVNDTAKEDLQPADKSKDLSSSSDVKHVDGDADVKKKKKGADSIETDEEAAKRTQRNIFMAGASVVLPIAFLLFNSEAWTGAGHKDNDDGDDYWGGQRSVGVA